MELQRVSKDLGRKLKEVGFPQGGEGFVDSPILYIDGRTRSFFFNTELKNRVCLIPTLELVKMWFREKYNLIVLIEINYDYNCFEYCIHSHPKHEFTFTYAQVEDDIEFNSYDEALEAGSLKVCEIIKNIN
jgi:hypothetical protein